MTGAGTNLSPFPEEIYAIHYISRGQRLQPVALDTFDPLNGHLRLLKVKSDILQHFYLSVKTIGILLFGGTEKSVLRDEELMVLHWYL